MYKDKAKTFMNYIMAKNKIRLIRLCSKIPEKPLQWPNLANPDIQKSKVRDPVLLIRNVLGPEMQLG